MENNERYLEFWRPGDTPKKIRCKKLDKIWDEYAQAQLQLINSKYPDAAKRIMNIKTAYEIFNKNFLNFEQYCRFCENNFKLFNAKDKEKYDFSRSELNRLLHNYLMSLSTLRGNIINLKRKTEHKDGDFFVAENKRWFDFENENGIILFMVDLRNEAGHAILPYISINPTMDLIDKKGLKVALRQKVYLSKSELDSSSFTKSKSYFSELPEGIEILPLCKESHSLISEYYFSFILEFRKKYAQSINSSNNTVHKQNEFYKKLKKESELLFFPKYSLRDLISKLLKKLKRN